MSSLILRQATLRDAEMLFEWRNDISTRRASRDRAELNFDGHLKWLAAVLDDSTRVIMIAEKDGDPVGVVRADACGDVRELSWTISPSARGNGYARLMVQSLIDRLPGRFSAEVMEDNPASISVAEGLGMTLDFTRDGRLHFSLYSL